MNFKQTIRQKLSDPSSAIWFYISGIIIISIVLFFIINLYSIEDQLRDPLLGLFWPANDGSGYYVPLESVFIGQGYSSICRMPALLPIYLLLRTVFDIFWTKNVIILIQIAASIIASVFAARIAFILTKKKLVFYFTLFALSTSFMLSQYAISGLMDSLAISLLVIGYYFVVVKKQTAINLLIAGLLVTWSVFFRQVLGLTFVMLLLWIAYATLKKQGFKTAVKSSILFFAPFLILIGSWNIYTYKKFDEMPGLVRSGNKCWNGYPIQLTKVVNLAIGWGGNFTKWNGEAEWFQTKGMKEEDFPFSHRVMTSAYNLDSLIQLRRDLLKSMDKEISSSEREVIAERVIHNATIYLKAYKKEQPFNYYFTNKAKLLFKFIIPNQIDGLPLPPLHEMNLFQIATKLFWWFTFALFNVLGVIGFVLIILKRKNDFLLHLSFMAGFFYITFYVGLIEQRYIAPYLPFIYMYAGYTIHSLLQFVQRKKEKLSIKP